MCLQFAWTAISFPPFAFVCVINIACCHGNSYQVLIITFTFKLWQPNLVPYKNSTWLLQYNHPSIDTICWSLLGKRSICVKRASFSFFLSSSFFFFFFFWPHMEWFEIWKFGILLGWWWSCQSFSLTNACYILHALL